MRLKQLLLLLLSSFGLLLSVGDCALADNVHLRFPVLYNPNALAGRLYLQPLDVHDDTLTKGWAISFDVGSATDYNIYFSQSDDDEELTVNTNIFSLAFSKDCQVASIPLELGAGIRVHQDKESTFLADVAESYHDLMPSDGFGKIPPDGQYYGEVGNNHTAVIAESGDIFISTLQLYGKYQLWEDKGPETMLPNLTLKLCGRIPLTNYDFDRPGIAFSAGLSKEVFKQVYLLGAAGIVYQDLEQEDFNADNLTIKKIAVDLFFGTIWDWGVRDDWYLQLGMRRSSKRISYSTNPESAESSWNVHFGLSYRTTRKNGDIVDFFLNFTEDIPGFGHGLEPDIAVYGGLSYHL